MNCLELIDSIARRQLALIQAQPAISLIATPDYGWENHRYSSPKFRQAHVEIFRQEKFGVVHCCIFPHADDPAPIYGFDIIAGESKITGVFMDLSPTENPTQQFCDIELGKDRQRPEWGDIFSPHWIACRPSPAEAEVIGNTAVSLLEKYFTMLGAKGNRETITRAQNYYCSQQQKNEHTRKALINLIGLEKTNEFMTEILFPCIKF
jgi:phycocyanobilin:ferredoxin oxidoreductase